MTVQELIDTLRGVENKGLSVVIGYTSSDNVTITTGASVAQCTLDSLNHPKEPAFRIDTYA